MRSLLAAAALAVVPVLGIVPEAGALSCVDPAAVLERAPVVFTGRIHAWSESTVVIDVDEVWKGEDLPERVAYDVEMAGWWPTDLFRNTSPEGKAFVFAPLDGGLSTCTTFRMKGPMADEVMSFRPAHPSVAAEPTAAAGPEEPSRIDEDLPAQSAVPVWAVAGGGVLAALAGAAAFLLFRRRWT